MSTPPEPTQESPADGAGKPSSTWRLWWLIPGGLILLAALVPRWIAPRASLRQQDSVPAPASVAASTAKAWYEAVQQGDRQAAITAAMGIVPGTLPPPMDAYSEFFEANRVPASFLVSSFTEWDAIYWEDLYFFRELAAKVPVPMAADTDGPAAADAELRAVSDFVRAQIVGEEPQAHNAWPREIWERGYGVCDRLCWVAAKLLYQRGYEVAIVYLHDNPEYQNSPHTILTVRRGERAWVMDLLMGRMMVDCSADTLAEQAALREQLWPDHPDWQRSMAYALLLIPSNPLEYCPRTAELAKRLQSLGITDLPRFGRDPMERQLAFQALREETRGGPPLLPIAPWTHPLRMFYLDLKLQNQHERRSRSATLPPAESAAAPTVILVPPTRQPPMEPAKGD